MASNVIALRNTIDELDYAFALVYVKRGGDEVVAWRILFPDATDQDCANSGFAMLQKPTVKHAITIMVCEAFAEDAVAARHVLSEVMRSITTPPSVRRQCALDIIGLAKLIPETPDSFGRRTTQSFNVGSLTKDEQETMEQLLEKMTNEE